MRKSRFTEERIVAVLKESEGSVAISDLVRRHGISTAVLTTGEAKRLKQLEDENRRLNLIVAVLSLDDKILKDVVSKKR